MTSEMRNICRNHDVVAAMRLPGRHNFVVLVAKQYSI
jgi:hypothetical protein